MSNLKGYRIEFHILQSFPVTCLNRDDVGAPKSAVVGGVPRARVSSQCWKRQVRLQLHELGVKISLRTKQVADVLTQACLDKIAAEDKACLAKEEAEGKVRTFAQAFAKALVDDTLLFFSRREAEAIADFALNNNFEVEAAIKKGQLTPEFKKLHKQYFNPAEDGLDIALFGRMVAQVPELNIAAAASFAHAISTHRSSAEVDFFTALDDDPMGLITQGSAHMGALEYNSATYYRYVSLDLGQLAETLAGRGLAEAVSNFTKALYLAVPSARQTTQTGLRLWDYARVLIRKGQGMQVSFERPVQSKAGFLAPSIEALNESLDRQQKQAGSLFGLVKDQKDQKDQDFEFGRAEAEISIEDLAKNLADFVRPFEVKE